MSKKRNGLKMLVGFVLPVLGYVALALNLSPLRLLLYSSGLSLFFGGCWQLDLLAAQAFWSLNDFIRDKDKPFLLPFNVPISKQTAYCLFFTWILVGVGVIMLALGVATL